MDDLYNFFKIKYLPKILVFGTKLEVPLMLRLLSNYYNQYIQVNYINYI